MTLNPFPAIWREVPAHFTVHGSSQKAAAALRARIRRSAISTPFSEACVGKVSDDSIRLRRYRPWLRNGMSPFLDARLVAECDGLGFVGVFRMTWYARIFLSVWFGAVLVFIPIFAVAGLHVLFARGDALGALFGVAPLVMFLFGRLLLAWGEWMWVSDESYIRSFVLSQLPTSAV